MSTWTWWSRSRPSWTRGNRRSREEWQYSWIFYKITKSKFT
jgi:hypothetical protein